MNKIDDMVDEIFSQIENDNLNIETKSISTYYENINGKETFKVNDKQVNREEYLETRNRMFPRRNRVLLL
jgi:hypothetical protein